MICPGDLIRVVHAGTQRPRGTHMYATRRIGRSVALTEPGEYLLVVAGLFTSAHVARPGRFFDLFVLGGRHRMGWLMCESVKVFEIMSKAVERGGP